VAVLTLPTYTDPFYSYTLALDGTSYVFDFRYNQREECWYLAISLEDGTELIKGQKLVCGTNLLRRAADVRLPRGLLTVVANGTDLSPPGLEELGEDKRTSLCYFTEDEAEA
jgi:hypothetical protein